MAEIINLRMARKVKTRAKAEQLASENRAKFGRSKSQKIADKAAIHRTTRIVDGARREQTTGDDG